MPIKKKRFFTNLIAGFSIFILLFLLAELQPKSMIAWVFCKSWHLVNEENIEFKNLQLILPEEWWVYDSDSSGLRLSAIPPKDFNTFGLVTVRQELITIEQLNSMTGKKDLGVDQVKFSGMYSREIGGKQAVGIIYDVPKDPEWKYVIWTIPETSTVIRGLKILKEDGGLMEKLFEGISFPNA